MATTGAEEVQVSRGADEDGREKRGVHRMGEWKVQVRKSSNIPPSSPLRASCTRTHTHTHPHMLIFLSLWLLSEIEHLKPHVTTVLGKFNQPSWPHFQQCPHFASRTSTLMIDMQQIQEHSHTGVKQGKRNTKQSETVSKLFGKPAAAAKHSNTHEHPLQMYLLSRRKPFTTEYSF